MFKRKTIIASNVLKILTEAKSPLSVSNIIEELSKEEIVPNKATVYRILTKLMDKKRVTEIKNKNGAAYFELFHNHHHHFICDDCETAFCLEGCHVKKLNINMSELLPSKNFKILSHDFNIYGICEGCVNK
ncbi:MAG: transcriptional repressor [bacterium]